ncbi:MAG: hypothetical protein ACRDNK_11790 [Solirubrobacteraceae bacterium]
MNARARRRLAVYRGWLMVSVVLAVFLILLVPPELVTYGPHDPAVVLPAIGALLGWWGTFTAAWVAHTKLPRDVR